MAAMGRLILAGCAGIVLLLSACNPGSDASRPSENAAQGDSLTITGTLVDTRCFNLDPANVGVDHVRPEGFVKACAQACANMGFPAAVLVGGEPGGDVWVLITLPSILADYMAETVRVDGVVRSAGVLIPFRVQYRAGDEWLTVM